MTDRFKLIRYIYLYLVTAICIVLILVSTIGLINLVLKEYVFDVKDYSEIYVGQNCNMDVSVNSEPAKLEECKKADLERAEIEADNNLKRDLVNYLAMLIVALPLYFYHWGIIKKENKNS